MKKITDGEVFVSYENGVVTYLSNKRIAIGEKIEDNIVKQPDLLIHLPLNAWKE